MICLKCSGVMIFENFYHQGNDFWAWHCVGCGEIIDSVILENRIKGELIGRKREWSGLPKKRSSTTYTY